MTLTVENVTKHFGKKTILENISFSLEAGHSYALLGRNGTGKSTLVNVIMQRTLYNGKVLIDGKSITDNDILMQNLFCMNDNTFYPSWMKLKTVFELTEAMYMDFDMDYAKKLADDFGIDLGKRIKQLSTGQRTLYKVILAFASNAQFIFLDEPVLGLDVNMRDLFYRTLAQKMSEERSCYVICTHLIEEIENLIENVIILHGTHIITDCHACELFTHFRSFSGSAYTVDSFASSFDVIGTEQMAGFKRIVIDTHGQDIIVPQGLNEDTLTVQDIFYHLTGGTEVAK